MLQNFPKAVFLTGATGFVGKAVIEKVIRTLPDDVVTYVLIRAKAKTTVEKRLKEEIFSSEIFQRVRLEKNLKDDESLFQYLKKRVIPIQGDVSLPNLGISDSDLNEILRPRITLAIHCAASVDFDERLDLAIGNNIFGALETVRLCGTFTNLKRFVHVSTAYVSVNHHHRRKIEEHVPKLEFDCDALIQHVLAIKSDLKELENYTQKVLSENRFPNTYTITKAIAEVLIHREFATNDKFSIHVVRPSIVGASWKEPVPGWVDTVSAASAVFLAGGMGIVTILPGDPRGVGDIIPVDLVANHILLAGFKVQSENFRVSHCCSSTENPVRWRVIHDSVQRSYLHIGLPKARLQIGSRNSMKMISDPLLFKLEWSFCYDVPTALLSALAAITRNPNHKKLAQLMGMLSERAGKVSELFTPFTKFEYFFSTDTSMSIWDAETKAEGVDLNVDVKDIAWSQYFYNYVYGLMRFVLHEDLIPVTQATVSHNGLKLNSERLVHWDADHHMISFPGLLPDITWAYTQSRAPGYTHGGLLGRALGLTGWREGLNHEARHVPRKTIRSPNEMMSLVLSSEAVRKALKNEVAKASRARRGKQTKRTTGEGGTPINPEKQIRANVRNKAEAVYTKLASTLEDTPPRAFGWFLRKIWRSLFDGIQVHELGIDRLRSLLIANGAESEKKAVVLLPSHRSYIDFLVLSYVMFAYNIPVPHIAASEDFLNMGPVSNLLRKSGAFFIRRDGSTSEDVIYREIFKEYVFRLLGDGQILEFFIEGTRSRSGKSIPPKNGMLKILSEAIQSNRVDDVILVPISVSYERPLEVSLYAEEMLGSSKPRENLLNLLRGASALGKRFGTISIQFADPVSLKALEVSTETPAIQIVRMTDYASVFYTTNLVAALLLMYRNGATFEQLLRGLEFMRQEVYKRGGRVVGVEGMRPEDTLTRALELMGPIVAKRDVPAVYQVDWSPRNWTNFLALSYYRNHITHLFCDEAIWAAAIHSHSGVASNPPAVQSSGSDLLSFVKGKPKVLSIKPTAPAIRDAFVTEKDLTQDIEFLYALLTRECISKSPETNALADLERRGVVTIDSKNSRISVKEARPFAMLCSMIWPLIDSYFIVATSLFALLNNSSIPLTELNSRMLALGETLYLDSVVVHYEACSSATLVNALGTFHEWGIVEYKKVALPKLPMRGSMTRVDVNLSAGFDSREVLQAFVSRIDKFRKHGHREFSTDAAGTPFGVAQFPVLARM